MQLKEQHQQRETPRTLPAARLCKIGLRTAHLMATSVLVGGYAFGAPAARLAPWFYVAIATGVGMIFFEAYPGWTLSSKDGG